MPTDKDERAAARQLKGGAEEAVGKMDGDPALAAKGKADRKAGEAESRDPVLDTDPKSVLRGKDPL